MAKVLLVDDEPALLRSYARALQAGGFTVDCATHASEAFAEMDRTTYDVIFTDISMPGLSGIELLWTVRTHDLDIPVVMMTGDPTVETAIAAMEFGAFRYLKKPIAQEVLLATASNAVLMHGLAKLKREALVATGRDGMLLGDRASLEARFSVALEKMWMAYQPIVIWPDRQILAYEALLRSDEPTLQHPTDLLDAAERLGQLDRLGRAVRARVARDLVDAPAGVDIFVNLHPRDLQDSEIYQLSAPLTPLASRIVLEITERASLEKIRTIESSTAALRGLGFRLAIDDLGAGYAGLTSLVHLDPEFLKIDMSLVRGIDVDPMKQRIVGSIAVLAGDLRKQIIAEGVETVAERDTLERVGCRNLQGYLFAMPSRGFQTPAWG